MTALTDENFDALVRRRKSPVVVVFEAVWAGPSRLLSQTLETLSTEDGMLPVLRMNVDDNPRTPTELGVRGVPTIIRFAPGGVVERMMAGALEIDDLRRVVARHPEPEA